MFVVLRRVGCLGVTGLKYKTHESGQTESSCLVTFKIFVIHITISKQKTYCVLIYYFAYESRLTVCIYLSFFLFFFFFFFNFQVGMELRIYKVGIKNM